MNKYAVITDIHGCYWTLKRLLSKIPEEYQVVFGGDLIDRGPNSHLVIAHAMKNKVPTVMGNHEHLMLDHYGSLLEKKRQYADGCWENNGGYDTIRSFGNTIPGEVLRWMMKLPIELDFDGLNVSHTAFGDPTKPFEAVWFRFGSDSDWMPYDGKFRVFGHTPDRWPILGPNFARIDTGCAYKKSGFGWLTAFLWPERVVMMEPYNEDKIVE